MAPRCWLVGNLGIRYSASKRKITEFRSRDMRLWPAARSLRLLFLDIVDDLGHVVLVLAEFGSILDQLFLFLLVALGERHGFLLVFDGLDILDVGIGVDRRHFLLDRQCRA